MTETALRERIRGNCCRITALTDSELDRHAEAITQIVLRARARALTLALEETPSTPVPPDPPPAGTDPSGVSSSAPDGGGA